MLVMNLDPCQDDSHTHTWGRNNNKLDTLTRSYFYSSIIIWMSEKATESTCVRILFDNCFFIFTYSTEKPHNIPFHEFPPAYATAYIPISGWWQFWPKLRSKFMSINPKEEIRQKPLCSGIRFGWGPTALKWKLQKKLKRSKKKKLGVITRHNQTSDIFIILRPATKWFGLGYYVVVGMQLK